MVVIVVDVDSDDLGEDKRDTYVLNYHSAMTFVLLLCTTKALRVELVKDQVLSQTP